MRNELQKSGAMDEIAKTKQSKQPMKASDRPTKDGYLSSSEAGSTRSTESGGDLRCSRPPPRRDADATRGKSSKDASLPRLGDEVLLPDPRKLGSGYSRPTKE